MTQAEFSTIAPGIPLQPGIYKYFGVDGELLYVGKAKSLRKRVSSYFSKTFTTYKTHELVNRIHKIEFTIVNSEQDAFLLENSLIKHTHISLLKTKISRGCSLPAAASLMGRSTLAPLHR